MSAVQTVVYGAFRDMGTADDRTLEAAAVPGKRDEDVTKPVQTSNSTSRR